MDIPIFGYVEPALFAYGLCRQPQYSKLPWVEERKPSLVAIEVCTRCLVSKPGADLPLASFWALLYLVIVASVECS